MIEKIKDLIPGYIQGSTCTEYECSEYSFLYKKIDEIIDTVNAQTSLMNRMTECIERNHGLTELQQEIICDMDEKMNALNNMFEILNMLEDAQKG